MESKTGVTPDVKALLSLLHLLHLLLFIHISVFIVNSDQLFIKPLWQETGQLMILNDRSFVGFPLAVEIDVFNGVFILHAVIQIYHINW